MRFDKLLKELDALNLPRDQYAITASGPLAVRGIRESNDIDIIVTKELWRELSEEHGVTKEEFETINVGNIQILGDGSIFSNPGLETTKKQIKDADVINGRRYVKLETVKKFKEAMDRDKDIRDIKLIDEYLDISKNHGYGKTSHY